MRVNETHLWLGLLPALSLAACTADGDAASSTASSAALASVSAEPVPGGSARMGSSIATMADQYNRPRAGTAVATGASAWVPAAPPPAFVIDELPPAPVTAANRPPVSTPTPQPAAPPAADAASIVRPEAAAPEAAAPTPAPAATLSAATREAGRRLFNENACGTCHALADAGASGAIGPGLDRNSRLTKDYVVSIVTNGAGAMPAFGGQMTDAQIATLAEYIVGVSRK